MVRRFNSRLGDPSLGCGATCVAFGSNGTLDWTFNILTYSAATSIHTADQLDMTGQGILTMTGHDPTLRSTDGSASQTAAITAQEGITDRARLQSPLDKSWGQRHCP